MTDEDLEALAKKCADTLAQIIDEYLTQVVSEAGPAKAQLALKSLILEDLADTSRTIAHTSAKMAAML